MSSSLIGITKAGGIGPLPSVLERLAGAPAVERAFSKAGVPLEVVEDDNHAIPMARMVSLFDHAAREAGDPYFGMRVGLEMDLSPYGIWTRYSAEAPTLRRAILRLQRSIWVHQTIGAMRLVTTGSPAVWSYIQPAADGGTGLQHGDHVIPVMIRFAQAYLGKDWQPEIVWGCHGGRRAGERPAMAAFGDYAAGHRGVSISIETHLLDTPRQRGVGAPLTSVDLKCDVAASRSSSELDELGALVSTRLLAGHADIEGLAEFTALSPRTIQRRLENLGLSYRQLVDRIRYAKASAFLAETDLSITDIALALGYSDPAHFTRAFRRWSGRPPSAVRRPMMARAG